MIVDRVANLEIERVRSSGGLVRGSSRAGTQSAREQQARSRRRDERLTQVEAGGPLGIVVLDQQQLLAVTVGVEQRHLDVVDRGTPVGLERDQPNRLLEVEEPEPLDETDALTDLSEVTDDDPDAAADEAEA